MNQTPLKRGKPRKKGTRLWQHTTTYHLLDHDQTHMTGTPEQLWPPGRLPPVHIHPLATQAQLVVSVLCLSDVVVPIVVIGGWPHQRTNAQLCTPEDGIYLTHIMLSDSSRDRIMLSSSFPSRSPDPVVSHTLHVCKLLTLTQIPQIWEVQHYNINCIHESSPFPQLNLIQGPSDI